jgi:hypothetical protein
MAQIGLELIAELKRRRIWGSFFGYEGYQQLKRIESPEELHAFLAGRGLPAAGGSDVAAIVDALVAWSEQTGE